MVSVVSRRLVVCCIVCLVTRNVAAGPKVVVGRAVAANQRISMEKVDHTAWEALLKRYVNEDGDVNYATWHGSADVAKLDQYLKALSHAEPQLRSSKEAKLAFWINAYNALTIEGILREYPTTSIRKHTPRLYGYHIWKDLQLMVGDSAYSLEQIEHEVLRKMGEPRVHFAIVCASRSCPRLLNEAYTSEKVAEQLVANAEAFFANQNNFRYSDGSFQLSSILKWFAEDFGNTQAARLRYIAPYLPDQTSQRAAARGAGRLSYLRYDWGLNDQKTDRTARR